MADAAIFSFHPVKHIACGEGGMITTNNHHAADRIRKMRLHGINRDAFNRPGWFYEVVEAGYKYNMMDIQAAIGIHQLKELDQMSDKDLDTIIPPNPEPLQQV